MKTGIVVALIFSISICFLTPLIGLIYFVKKDKKLLKSFGIGMLIFFISQIVIRIPILTYVLPNTIWFIKLSQEPYLYGIFLGLTAGIFEEVGRYIAFKYMLKSSDKWLDGISYGVGHGGIEAILITGISCLITLVSISNKSFETGLTPAMAFLPGIERLSAMSIHIGLSMIVFYGVRNKKIRYLFLAILIHTLVNAPIVIFPQVFNVGVIGMEIYIFIWALILGGVALKSKNYIQINFNL